MEQMEQMDVFFLKVMKKIHSFLNHHNLLWIDFLNQ